MNLRAVRWPDDRSITNKIHDGVGFRTRCFARYSRRGEANGEEIRASRLTGVPTVRENLCGELICGKCSLKRRSKDV